MPSQGHRRDFLRQGIAATTLAGMTGASLTRAADDAATPIALGTRRELFLDQFLVDRFTGKAELRLHHPQPRELALVHDAPWEGSGSGYHSIFQDGGLYRMYYKAWNLDVSSGKLRTNAHPLFCCYAESDDGIHWRKPNLGIHEFQGSTANNITITSGKLGNLMVDAGHPAVFKDENPRAESDARYKAFIRSDEPNGVLPFKSADGLHWSPMSTGPVITDGAFDSQNLAFWDSVRGHYRAYWRTFTRLETGKSVRSIRTATSPDFLHWSDQADLTYTDSPPEELYTNQIKPYHRAPHILIGFPTRYVDRGAWLPSMNALPEPANRRDRFKAGGRYGTAITEALVMASRDGVRFSRWNEAFLRPGIERAGTWNYGHQYIGWQLVETASALEGAPKELSLYAGESYWTGNSSALRRYTLRLDGFASVNAPMSGGEVITRPITFEGERLLLNMATSAAGGLRVELQDAAGRPIEGHALDDCDEVFGDAIERPVTWKDSEALSGLAGKPIRLRVVLRDADLFALRFAAKA